MKPQPTCFAVVPAAGQSLRMRPDNKLLLTWRHQRVIDHVLGAWTTSLVKRVVMVVRHDDAELQEIGRAYANVDVVIPDIDPEDMKRSIQWGLEHIADRFQPAGSDRWLVAPADLPTLSSDLINELINASHDSDSIVVPRFGDQQGHPVSFPWHVVDDVFALESDQGINQIVATRNVQWLALPADRRPVDIDTPEDFQRLSAGQEPESLR